MVESARICESLAITAAMTAAPSIDASQSGAYPSTSFKMTSSPDACRRRSSRRSGVSAGPSAARVARASTFAAMAGTVDALLAATPRKTDGSQIAIMQDGDGIGGVIEEADRHEAEDERACVAPEPDVLMQHVHRDDDEPRNHEISLRAILRHYMQTAPSTVPAASRETLDAWVREIVDWHFD